jgi:hypothetical protein
MSVTMIEDTVTYSNLFESLKVVAQKYLTINDFIVERLIADHSEPELNACREQFVNSKKESTQLIPCTAHLERKVNFMLLVVFFVFLSFFHRFFNSNFFFML